MKVYKNQSAFKIIVLFKRNTFLKSGTSCQLLEPKIKLEYLLPTKIE